MSTGLVRRPEDLDLAIGRRRGTASLGLNDFLLALDGAMTTHEAVVTIGTTNDASAIDVAAQRAGRFDAVIHVDLPDGAARAAILRRLLRVELDVGPVAAATAGWSGAELRELVTRAVLRDEVTVETLLELVREQVIRDGPGHYL